MNDRFEQTIQALANLKSQFDTAITTATKKMVESPETQQIVEIIKKAKQTIPVVLKQFAEAIAPYEEISRLFITKVAPCLLELAQVSERLGVIDRLGEAQYVTWRGFPDIFYKQALATQTKQELLKVVWDWHKDNAFVKVDETISLLLKNENLKDNRVFAQAVDAYRRGEYDIASLGFTAMIDSLLSVYTGMINSPRILERVEAIRKKVKQNGEEALDDVDLKDYILITTYFSALRLFGESRKFSEDEPDLNRHWIAHGRMNRGMEQIDCIRLINMLYGTTLVGELGEC